MIVHAYEQWGEAAFARFNGQFARGAVGRAREQRWCSPATASASDRSTCASTRGRLWFASEVKAIFAATRRSPARSTRSASPRPSRSGRRSRPADRVRGHHRARARARPDHHPDGDDGPRVLGAVLPSRRGRRPSTASLDEAAERVRDDARRGRSPAHAPRRRARRQLPLGRARQLARRRARPRAPRATASAPSRSAFEDAEYDETRIPAGDGERSRQRPPRDHGRAARTSRTSSPMSSPTPSGRSCGRRPRRCSCCRGWSARSGIKVVLTGEGADEMFAGYDLFREAKVRRFWGREPDSTMRPRLLERLYPYLARSPVAQRAHGASSSSAAAANDGAEPGFAHQPRWQIDRGAPAAVHARTCAASAQSRRRRRAALATLPADFRAGRRSPRTSTWRSRTLLSGYLLSSQGDRMLMAHSVEGRFPVPRHATSWTSPTPCRARTSFRGSTRSTSSSASRRASSPTRSSGARSSHTGRPDAACFIEADAPAWVADAISERAVTERAFSSLRRRPPVAEVSRTRPASQLSNADNMALVGVLSTALLFEQLVRRAPEQSRTIEFQTVVDRWPGHDADRPLARGSREMMST